MDTQGIFVCGADPGGRGWGLWAGGWGVPGNFQKLGPTHKWLFVGGGGCTYITYICICDIKCRSRPMGHQSPSDFFLKIAEPTALASTGHSNQTNISAYY